MSAYVKWFEDYSCAYNDNTTVEPVSELLMLNVSPFNFGQFVIESRSWTAPTTSSAAVLVSLEGCDFFLAGSPLRASRRLSADCSSSGQGARTRRILPSLSLGAEIHQLARAASRASQ